MIILKQLLLGVAVCMSGLLSAQKTALVECRVEDGLRLNAENKISLYRVERGRMVEMATGEYASSDGYFAFQFVPPYEGFYVVGNERNYNTPVWLKAGEKVSVSLGREKNVLFGKKNTAENNVLYEWLALAKRVGDISTRSFLSREVGFPVFFEALEQLAKEKEVFKRGIRTKNAYFNRVMTGYVDYMTDYYAMNYVSTPKPQGYVWPKTADFSPYYETIVSDTKFQDIAVFNYPDGFRLAHMYTGMARRLGKLDKEQDAWSVLPCKELQGEIVLSTLGNIRSVFQFRKLMQKSVDVMTPAQRAKAETLLAALEKKNSKQQAVDFTYPDVNGKMVSLSDFKGKVVLLDIWATWCGPCRGELPHLLKLEEEMKDTDLVVIGVSTDTKKGYEKWKQMVENGEVKGVQLFSNGGKELKEAYQVNGIPRFIVFDREGKVAEAAAPRPSDPALKELLNELLKK